MSREKVSTAGYAPVGDPDETRRLTPVSAADLEQPQLQEVPISTTRPAEPEHPVLPDCPHCQRNDVRRSYARGTIDAVARVLGYRPYRCRWCRTRFFATGRAPAATII